ATARMAMVSPESARVTPGAGVSPREGPRLLPSQAFLLEHQPRRRARPPLRPAAARLRCIVRRLVDVRPRDPPRLLVSPFMRRVLFVVAAAIRFATPALRPRRLALRLICSYWRSRLLLQELGIRLLRASPGRQGGKARHCLAARHLGPSRLGWPPPRQGAGRPEHRAAGRTARPQRREQRGSLHPRAAGSPRRTSRSRRRSRRRKPAPRRAPARWRGGRPAPGAPSLPPRRPTTARTSAHGTAGEG